MSLGDLLPVQFYEIAFMCTFLLIPVVAFRADLENYIFGMLVIYMLLRTLRRRKRTKLAADGKAVFISGCDSGFGYFIAEKLDSEGYVVFAGCLDDGGEGASDLKAKCSDRLHIVALDVTSDDSVSAAGNYVRENLGDNQFWAVVNNAGVYGHGDVELCPVQTYKFVADVNVYGMVRLTQQFLPLVRRAQGRVVNMSSIQGSFTWPFISAYTASKYGVECISDSLRMEMIKFGVKVAIIEPGMFSGNTNIVNEQNAARLYNQIDEFWENSSVDVKSVYTKQYMKYQIELIVHLRAKTGAKNADAVVDAVTDAVSSSAPQYRYAVHGGKFPVDPLVIFSKLCQYLPEAVTDWCMCKIIGHLTPDILQGHQQTAATKDGLKSE